MRIIRASLCILAIASVILIVSSIPYDSDGSSVIDSGYCGHDITWTYYDDGLLVIEGTGWMYDYVGDEFLPWSDYFDSIRTIYLKGTFVYGYNFYYMKKLESIRTDHLNTQSWFSINDSTNFREVVLESCESRRIDIGLLETNCSCHFDLSDMPSLIGGDVHIYFYEVSKKEIPKEYKSLVGNGSLYFFKINDYDKLPVEIDMSKGGLYEATDDAIVTLLDTGEHLETVAEDWTLFFKLDRCGYFLVSVEQVELIPYSIPIAIVIALIGIIGSIFYYFTRIRGGVKHES